MLKLNAAYSKKVPADSQYSSQSYHCSIESELPDGLTPQQLQAKVHDVFDFVRNSVEAEIPNGTQVPQMPPQQQMPVQQTPPQQPAPQAYSAPQAQPAQQQYYDPQANYQQPQQAPQHQNQPSQNRQYRNANAAASASPKQVNYLLNLAKRAGWTVQQILQRCNVPAVDQIPSKLCSQLIQEFSGTPA